MKQYTIENDNISLTILDKGASILSLKVFTDNQWRECTLAYEDIEEYDENLYYLNSVTGPHAGRVKYGKYMDGDKEIQLDCNNQGHHLHGGKNGTHQHSFKITKLNNALIANYYDEKLQIYYQVIFSIDNNEVNINYLAIPKHKTLINMTQHTYFNLSQENTIENHKLQIDSDKVNALDEQGVPSKEFIDVTNTVFDFKKSKTLKENMQMDHAQFKYSSHIDHPYYIPNGKVKLTSPDEKINLEIISDADYAVVYLANYFLGEKSFKDRGYSQKHQAIAIEPQNLPNGVNLGIGSEQLYSFERPFRRNIKYIFKSV